MALMMSPTHCVAWQLFRISTLPLSSLTSHHGLMLPWQLDGYCSFLDSCTQYGKCQAKAGKQLPLHKLSGVHSLSLDPQRSQAGQNRALGVSVPWKSYSHPCFQFFFTLLPSFLPQCTLSTYRVNATRKANKTMVGAQERLHHYRVLKDGKELARSRSWWRKTFWTEEAEDCAKAESPSPSECLRPGLFGPPAEHFILW